jgi:hypothetical protein
MLRNIIVIFVLLILHACDSEKKALKKAKREALAEMKKEAKKENDSLNNINYHVTSTEFNRDEYENKYLDTLKHNLDKNVVPGFIYDLCLDNRSASYYYLNSETKISLRYNLISRMGKDEIKRLIRIADPRRLQQICNDPKEDMQYANESTFSLLNNRLNNDSIK